MKTISYQLKAYMQRNGVQAYKTKSFTKNSTPKLKFVPCHECALNVISEQDSKSELWEIGKCTKRKCKAHC